MKILTANTVVCLYQAVAKTTAMVIPTVGHSMSIQQNGSSSTIPDFDYRNFAASKTGHTVVGSKSIISETIQNKRLKF